MSALFREVRSGGGFPTILAVATIVMIALVAKPVAALEEGPSGAMSVLVRPSVSPSPSSKWDADAGGGLATTQDFVADSTGDCSDESCFQSCCRSQSGDCEGECRPGCGQCTGWANADCEPPGLLQRIVDHHATSNACWLGRADALILWRNAPPDRPILDNSLVVGPLLNANGLDSTAAAGPRFSVFRANECTGHAVEVTYLRAANFRSVRPLSAISEPYVLAAPGIYGNNTNSFSSGDANLGSRVQSLEVNRHHCHGRYLRFLAGFRWIDWQEQFTLQGAGPNQGAGANRITDFYQTSCFNDLYGGQIGLDANLLATSWIRFDGLIKAGAYYNNAVQSSEYTTSGDPETRGSAAVTVNQSPVSGAFAGELGFTGVMPITANLDFRLGYFGLWLSGIAQPTQQLSGQQLTPRQPAVGTINANGGVLVQGVSLGLEGRW
jgi:hypothetical protein